MKVGEIFTISGAHSLLPRFVTTEVVCDTCDDGKWSFDTLIIEQGSPAGGFVMERRYMVESQYTVNLDAHQRGTKDYHYLFEEHIRP